METTRKRDDSTDIRSPAFLRTPASLTSSLSSPVPSLGVSLTREQTRGRDRSNLSPRTPALLPFDNYSPIRTQRNPLSRTQTQTTGGIFSPRSLGTANQSPSREPVDETARTNALWAEMRATLAEVETLAVGNAQQTHFFGPQHATALEELRAAQIALASAWAQADSDVGEDTASDPTGKEANNEASRSNAKVPSNGKDPAGHTSKDGNRGRSGSTTSTGSASLDTSSSATEKDIASARLRREANDEYFYRVSQGVTNVVDKLEEITKAMDRVERASRSAWSDEEDSDQENQGKGTGSTERNQQGKEKAK